MIQVWAGSITTDDPTSTFKDIELWNFHSLGRCPITPSAKLHFLSLVHVPSIPLCLAAGPSLHLSTDSDIAITWLNESLLRSLNHEDRVDSHDTLTNQRWADVGVQLDQGILLRVDDEDARGGHGNQITEVLLYAAIDANQTSLPTPPRSSSPTVEDKVPELPSDDTGTVKVYALPLSSHILKRAGDAELVIPPYPGDFASTTSTHFLPHHDEQSQVTQRLNQKRQSLSMLFDDATHKRRKLKGRGGESIAQAMANIDRPASQISPIIEMRVESQEKIPMVPHDAGTRQGLSRASGVTSAAGSDYVRPNSRSGALANGKRSSLHRVESVISPRDSPTVSEVDDGYGTQNKTALTKIVMAGMRLYGLQQKKRQAKGPPEEPSNSAPNESNREEEFKLVYHQAFKAATFTFRRQISSMTIPQETMRDVVDRLLHLLCTDPMAFSCHNDENITGFGTQVFDVEGYFDLPSGKDHSPVIPGSWKSPTIKRR